MCATHPAPCDSTPSPLTPPSAGIGRTGCFIATRIGCQQLKARGEVDILRIVCQLRLDRWVRGAGPRVVCEGPMPPGDKCYRYFLREMKAPLLLKGLFLLPLTPRKESVQNFSSLGGLRL